MLQVAARARRHRADHAHRGGLAGAVRAEQPERLARRDLERDAVDGGEVAVLLDEVGGGDDGSGGHPANSTNISPTCRSAAYAVAMRTRVLSRRRPPCSSSPCWPRATRRGGGTPPDDSPSNPVTRPAALPSWCSVMTDRDGRHGGRDRGQRRGAWTSSSSCTPPSRSVRMAPPTPGPRPRPGARARSMTEVVADNGFSFTTIEVSRVDARGRLARRHPAAGAPAAVPGHHHDGGRRPGADQRLHRHRPGRRSVPHCAQPVLLVGPGTGSLYLGVAGDIDGDATGRRAGGWANLKYGVNADQPAMRIPWM